MGAGRRCARLGLTHNWRKRQDQNAHLMYVQLSLPKLCSEDLLFSLLQLRLPLLALALLLLRAQALEVCPDHRVRWGVDVVWRTLQTAFISLVSIITENEIIQGMLKYN